MIPLATALEQRVPLVHVILPMEIDLEALLPVLVDISKANPYYVKQFLQILFKHNTQDDLDALYDLFADLIMAKPLAVTQEDVITYSISSFIIKIKETPRLISGNGTTGLRTWEAALFLSTWLLEHYSEQLLHKMVLELGAGTGLVSLSLLKSLTQLNRLIITDGDSTLIDSLAHNFALNGINHPDPSITCQSLWWGIDSVPQCDVIIGADVTYDSSVIPSLVSSIHTGLHQGASEALIAATVRNEDTLQTFEDALTGRRMQWEVLVYCEHPDEEDGQKVWYPPNTPGIRIYRIRI